MSFCGSLQAVKNILFPVADTGCRPGFMRREPVLFRKDAEGNIDFLFEKRYDVNVK